MPRKKTKKGSVARKTIALDKHRKAVVKKNKYVARDDPDKEFWGKVIKGQEGDISRSAGVVKDAKTGESMKAYSRSKRVAKAGKDMETRRRKKAKKRKKKDY